MGVVIYFWVIGVNVGIAGYVVTASESCTIEKKTKYR